VRAAAAAGLLLILCGCTAAPLLESDWPASAPDSIELIHTPFHPQEDYQCGPAALATLLGADGIQVAPEALTAEVYIPARKGSLQPEMIAAARRRGLVVYRIRPRLADLLAQLNAGLPVLVLENLGLKTLPVWHYAVVIGASREPEQVILRSGTTRRRVESASTFSRHWRFAENWGFVTLQPGELPYDPDWPVYLAAVADLEAGSAFDAASLAYQAALEVAPELTAARLGLANVHYATGNLSAAADLYQTVSTDPLLGVAALNNLANLRLDQNCREAAEQALAVAEARLTADSRLSAVLASTRARLAKSGSDSPGKCLADPATVPAS